MKNKDMRQLLEQAVAEWNRSHPKALEPMRFVPGAHHSTADFDAKMGDLSPTCGLLSLYSRDFEVEIAPHMDGEPPSVELHLTLKGLPDMPIGSDTICLPLHDPRAMYNYFQVLEDNDVHPLVAPAPPDIDLWGLKCVLWGDVLKPSHLASACVRLNMAADSLIARHFDSDEGMPDYWQDHLEIDEDE